jgi:hypothetical protein
VNFLVIPMVPLSWNAPVTTPARPIFPGRYFQ